jgi:hypothetical protein
MYFSSISPCTSNAAVAWPKASACANIEAFVNGCEYPVSPRFTSPLGGPIHDRDAALCAIRSDAAS